MLNGEATLILVCNFEEGGVRPFQSRDGGDIDLFIALYSPQSIIIIIILFCVKIAGDTRLYMIFQYD